MIKDNFLKANLQFFAEGGDETERNNNEQSENDNAKSEEVTYTQSELDAKISKASEKNKRRLAEEYDKKLQEEIERVRREEQSYAKMTQKEKEEQELSKREKAIAEREKAQALKELKSDVVDDLKEQELPTSFADALIKIEDNEEIKDVIRQIKKDFDSAVGEKVKEATRQATPTNQGSSFSRNQSRKEKGLGSIADEVRIIQ
ncbi:capsid assembly scaffolding protein Gp46 family protein [Staphylococcus haemolyticus]|jgi:hypothetical protein|uniref:capsid assembly scaffolding protein Gp46 family protein n=2 Tax=Staphylococcus haemolyticus TaxID=1283 RepID=UPI00069DA332|nr:DUF4355 domain-containing protein [Staphylococcus haemolyticus]MCH4520180.1 DUF4355 domain-containing protein [Staphylococcus haemolyticus]MDY1594549.1 DUF4355 domain-containing protein [Staphylococcus haemolyticus]PAK69934.1 hypothetical protein B8W97_07595 [Staphylococcus haemolyticus]DAZ18442.1 MAG TPA: capsid scaffolding protein [Caudoviricetes sp.]